MSSDINKMTSKKCNDIIHCLLLCKHVMNIKDFNTYFLYFLSIRLLFYNIRQNTLILWNKKRLGCCLNNINWRDWSLRLQMDNKDWKICRSINWSRNSKQSITNPLIQQMKEFIAILLPLKPWMMLMHSKQSWLKSERQLTERGSWGCSWKNKWNNWRLNSILRESRKSLSLVQVKFHKQGSEVSFITFWVEVIDLLLTNLLIDLTGGFSGQTQQMKTMLAVASLVEDDVIGETIEIETGSCPSPPVHQLPPTTIVIQGPGNTTYTTTPIQLRTASGQQVIHVQQQKQDTSKTRGKGKQQAAIALPIEVPFMGGTAGGGSQGSGNTVTLQIINNGDQSAGNSTSRHNLETIVEAIRHLEGRSHVQRGGSSLCCGRWNSPWRNMKSLPLKKLLLKREQTSKH